MLTSSAIAIINDGIIFFPGWEISAEDFTNRHEGCVCLYINVASYETNRPEAMAGFPVQNHAKAAVLIQVADCKDDIELHRLVLETLISVWTHEAREAYRIKPTGWSPFHPHQIDGMKRWGNPQVDLYYGFNAMKWSD